jgi:hypothetical protein
MKQLTLLLGAAVTLFFTSCDTTREITINENGSGTVVTTADMSALIGLAKMSGQDKDMDKMKDAPKDTTIKLSSIVDSVQGFTDAEKALVKEGTVNLVMNLEDEKFLTRVNIPYTSLSNLAQVETLSGKMLTQSMKKAMDAAGEDAKQQMGDEELPESSLETYYVTTYEKGKITRKLDAAKYAKVDDDKGLQAMKEMSQQGMPVTNTLVFNLPKAAKKAEGKNVKLSEDKKKVTINSDLADFFDDGKKLEFSIEY